MWCLYRQYMQNNTSTPKPSSVSLAPRRVMSEGKLLKWRIRNNLTSWEEGHKIIKFMWNPNFIPTHTHSICIGFQLLHKKTWFSWQEWHSNNFSDNISWNIIRRSTLGFCISSRTRLITWKLMLVLDNKCHVAFYPSYSVCPLWMTVQSCNLFFLNSHFQRDW